MKLNQLFIVALALLIPHSPLTSFCEEPNNEALNNIQSLTELASWLEKNPPEVVPLSGITGQRLLSQSLTTLRQNVDKLQYYLRTNGDIGVKWAKILSLDELKTVLREASPDLGSLEKINSHFHSHQWGLEVTEIRRVAKGLNDYILLRMTIEENIDPAEGLKEAIDRLIKVLKKTNNSSLDSTSELNVIVNWLETNRQAPEICQAIRRLSNKYNFYAQISDNLVLKFFDRPIDQTQPISEYIVGRLQSGKTHTVGNITGKLNPDPDKINLSVILNGSTSGNSYSQSRNITVWSASNNTLYGIKNIYFDGQQLTTTPARSNVQVKSTITGINSPGGLIQSAATSRIYELKPQADAETSYKTRARLEGSMNKELGARITKANSRLKQGSELYRARGIYPDPFNCSTTEHELKFKGLVSDGIPIISHDIPEAPQNSDIFVAIHQSAIIESCKTMLSDLKANQRVFMAIARSMLPEKAYEELSKKAAKNTAASGGHIFFNAQYPVNVQFTDDTIIIDIRIDAFQGKDSASPQEIPMNLSLAYKIDKIDKNGVSFKRTKEPELVPRDFETETRRLTTQETTLRNRLQKELKDSLPDSFQIKPLKLDEMTDKNNPDAVKITGTIKPVSAKAADGWLTINWVYQE